MVRKADGLSPSVNTDQLYLIRYKIRLDIASYEAYNQRVIRKLIKGGNTMKYIIDTGIEELMLSPQELEAYARKLWEEHQQVLYLDIVVQDTMYFGITDAE